MKKSNFAAGLGRLLDENPSKFVSLVRLAWPDIKAALERGHSVKVIHERFVKCGIRISYRLFALYVGQLRRESESNFSGSTAFSGEGPARPATGQLNHVVPSLRGADEENGLALVRVPKRRLFSARAAAQYLGVHERTLKKITENGSVAARQLGARRVYALEDLDAYIETLPKAPRAS